MKYMLLIHQGSTPTPRTEAWNEVCGIKRAA